MEAQLKVTVLIPIKEHSSRVPGKNFRQFCGRPLYLWILESLARCNHVKRVIISTDSQSLIESFKNGQYCWPEGFVVVDRRPPNLCGDAISVNLLWLNLLPSRKDSDPQFLLTWL